MAEWHNVQYKIVWNQDTESTQMPPWRSPSWLVTTNFYAWEKFALVKQKNGSNKNKWQ